MDAVARARKNPALRVATNSVRPALVYHAEHPAARERAFRLHVEPADVVRLSGVRDVELLFIRRETQAVGHVEILDHDERGVGFRVEAENVIAGLLFRCDFGQPVGRIGEPNRPIGLHNHIVWRVEFLAVARVRQAPQPTAAIEPTQAASGVLAGDPAVLVVHRVAVGIKAWLAKRGETVLEGPFLELIRRNVAEDQIAAVLRQPDRSFSKLHARGKLCQLRVRGYALFEFRLLAKLEIRGLRQAERGQYTQPGQDSSKNGSRMESGTWSAKSGGEPFALQTLRASRYGMAIAKRLECIRCERRFWRQVHGEEGHALCEPAWGSPEFVHGRPSS